MIYQKLQPVKAGNEIKRVAAYIRVSSKRQEKEGNSIENQEEQIKSYARNKGWELPNELVFIDSKPATKAKGKEIDKHNLAESYEDIRPALTELLIAAGKGSFDHLIVYNRDRLARVVEEYLAIDIFLKRCGIGVTYLKEGEVSADGNPAINRLLNVILSSIAELETNMLSSRVRDGNKTCVYKDWWPGGRTPFGYVRVKAPNDIKDRHTILEKSNFESDIVETVFKLYLQGLGYKRIADEMEEEYGYFHWTKNKVRTIICNRTYTGSIYWNRRGGRRNPKVNDEAEIISSSKFEENEIISSDNWEISYKVRKERSKTRDSHILNTPFLLKSKLVCAGCNKVMKTKNPGKNKSLIYYCSTKECKDRNGGRTLTIPKKIVEHEFNMQLVNMLTIEDLDALQNKYYEVQSQRNKEYEEIINQIKQTIEKSRSTINSIDYRLIQLDKDDEYIKKALETRRIVEGTAIEEYEKILLMYEGKIDNGRLEEDKLKHMLEVMPQYISALQVDEEDSKYRDVLVFRRIFVLHFIDEVKAGFDKNTGRLNMVIKCNFSQKI